MICHNKSSSVLSKVGFTLVELSIVIVIIGLLIGGILVGQSLIDSAQINQVLSKANQYKIAVNLFKDKTRYWPGDAGAGVGIPLGIRGNQNQSIDLDNGEHMFAFSQMAVFGIMKSEKDNVYLTSQCDNSGRATNYCYLQGPHKNSQVASYSATFKISKISINGIGLPVTPTSSAFAPESAQEGQYYISYGVNPTPSNTHQYHKATLTTLQAMAVDKKTDDGNPTMGKVLAISDSSGNTCKWPGCNCIDDNAGAIRDGSISYGDSYNLKTKDDGPQCQMLFYLGSGNSVHGATY